MQGVEEQKYVILNEWTDDPPAGCVTLYYDSLFEEPDEVEPLIYEIIDHIKDAIGYYEPDEEDLKDEDYIDEIEGLSPFDEDGNLSLEAIKKWSWDNGGSGCGCVVFAEGSEIADAVTEFYEYYIREDLDEPDFDPDDDDEEIELEFNVTICLGNGDGGDVSVDVPVSVRELKLITRCAIEDKAISDCDELSNLVERISEAALDENQSISEELGSDETFDDATCMISSPVNIEDYDMFTADCIVEYARENKDNLEAIEKLTKMMSELIERLNDSIW